MAESLGSMNRPGRMVSARADAAGYRTSAILLETDAPPALSSLTK